MYPTKTKVDAYLHGGFMFCAGAGPPKPKRGMMQALKEDVLTNKFIWLFALAYFFVYVVRQGVTSWFVFYLKACPLHPPPFRGQDLGIMGHMPVQHRMQVCPA